VKLAARVAHIEPNAAQRFMRLSFASSMVQLRSAVARLERALLPDT
jgi:bifunctional pyridoxal-dependent enzyme with beta-cystathionase and maltose regulon repressor activities